MAFQPGKFFGNYQSVLKFLRKHLTGRKERAARKLIAKIKKKYKKERGDFISVDEFCDFTSLKKESVREFLST